MDDSNKVDLKDVNKVKKSFKLTQITNTFKKQKGPKRDQEGKFVATTGGGGLVAAKKFDWKRAAPVIALVTLVGGIFVYQSFAGSTSGAFVTEMYQRCHNKMISSGSGYDYWVSRLSKGESQNAVFSAFVAASGSSCQYPYPPAAANAKANTAVAPAGTTTGKASISEAEIKKLYQDVLSRQPSANDIAFWLEKSKTWTPAQIKAHIENTPESFKKNIAKYVTEAQAWDTLANAYMQNALSDKSNTYKIATKNPVSRDELSSVAQVEGRIRGSVGQLSSAVGKINNWKANADKDSTLKTQATQLGLFASNINAQIGALNNVIGQVAADYKKAERTYEANLGFFEKLKWQMAEEAKIKAAREITARTAYEDTGRGAGAFGGKTGGNTVGQQAPRYANPTNYDCSAYRGLYVNIARHGWYVSCVVKSLTGSLTSHDADSLKLSCPIGYRESSVHVSNNRAGTAGNRWEGRLCQSIL